VPDPFLRGRLGDPGSAPSSGERAELLLERPGIAIEHILTGRLAGPVDYRQPAAEWVVLLAGSARLEVGGEAVELTAGDWIFLPAGIEHRLEDAAPGSSWLAVHIGP
jgi:cupin 2 domain-containing protein